ncbi:dynactin subunit 2 [Chrysoperla carnea]|uniref:dynactin subunit 2 n=1 Tax=Chrysoperla carnea TaxID=189513 RepID=UPI001D0700EF|nr:dynactin subunit 2 [Chrysoperla carnea]
MADPKYADLPGIAYDQPDTYETTDLPEADQSTDFFEEENDSIERLHISASEAYNKFKGKYLNAKQVDFSEKLSRRTRTGYDARSGDWELVGEGEQETPLQKYQRLKCEIHDLLEEINKLKESAKDDSQIESLPTVKQVEQSDALLRELRLEETLGKEVITNLSDPQGTQLKKLLTLLEQFKKSGSETTPESTTAKKGDANLNAVTYKLEYRPEQAKLAQSIRIGELEHRLHKLETVLGTESDKVGRLSQATNQDTILEAIQYLTAKSSALDSTQLDHIEGRLIALTQKMNTIAKQRTGTAQDAELEQMANELLNTIKKTKGKSTATEDQEIHQMVVDLYELIKKMNANSAPSNVEKLEKVNELYNFVKTIEPMVDLLPQTVQRLNALNVFHQQAIEFSNSLSQLESLQNQISSGVQNNKALLQGVQESFAINLDVINKNITSLNERLDALKK